MYRVSNEGNFHSQKFVESIYIVVHARIARTFFKAVIRVETCFDAYLGFIERVSLVSELQFTLPSLFLILNIIKCRN